MNRAMRVVVSAIALLGLTCYGEPATISASGAAKVQLPVDFLEWSVLVSSAASTLPKCLAANDAFMTELTGVLDKYKVSKQDRRLSAISYRKNYGGTSSLSVDGGYCCSRSLTFNLRDLSSYQQLAEALVQLKGIDVTNLTPQSTKEEEVKAAVRTQALDAARKKAGEMAAVLGMQILTPLKISERELDPRMTEMVVNANKLRTPERAGFFDSIDVTATVDVTFEMTKKQ